MKKWTLLFALTCIVITSCFKSEEIRNNDDYMKVVTSFLEAAKNQPARAIELYISSDTKFNAIQFLHANKEPISFAAIRSFMVLEKDASGITLRVHIYRRFTKAEAEAENKRVGISCYAREFGVPLAVYEFVISKDKKIISILEVDSLWDKPNQMVTNNCKRSRQST